MKATLHQLAARVDQGGPMQRRRRYRIHRPQRSSRQQPQFEAHLRRESRSARTPDIMPPTVVKKNEQTDTDLPTHQPTPSAHARAAWRRSFRHGLMHLRRANPHSHQSQIGWVMARLSRSLTDNPYMAESDVESLVDSLIAKAPVYETGEEV